MTLRLSPTLADEIAIMQNGIIVEIDETQNLFRNMKHPYTRSLFAASGTFS